MLPGMDIGSSSPRTVRVRVGACLQVVMAASTEDPPCRNASSPARWASGW